MNEQELRKAIDQTREEIYRLKRQIEVTNDPKALLQLKRKLKELRFKQFRQIDELG